MAATDPIQSTNSVTCEAHCTRSACCFCVAVKLAAKHISRYWFVLIAVVALAELGAWFWQTRPTMHDQSWQQVRHYLEKQLQAEDLVQLSPSWIDPIGRMHLGDEIMTEKRVARSDESRFVRALQVSWRGHRNADTADWTVKSEQSFGSLRIRELINPRYTAVIDDLVDHADPHRLSISIRKNDNDESCSWRTSDPIARFLGSGPAVPQRRAHCPSGAWIGATINADTQYRPRKCIFAPPPGDGSVTALRFKAIKFGSVLQGHHALYVEAERDRKGPAVTIVFSVGEHQLGRAVHHDGDGWSQFSFKTPELAGKTAPLEVTVSSSTAHRRMYCFEATTR